MIICDVIRFLQFRSRVGQTSRNCQLDIASKISTTLFWPAIQRCQRFCCESCQDQRWSNDGSRLSSWTLLVYSGRQVISNWSCFDYGCVPKCLFFLISSYWSCCVWFKARNPTRLAPGTWNNKSCRQFSICPIFNAAGFSILEIFQNWSLSQARVIIRFL